MSYSQAVTWEMHHGQGMGIYVPPAGSPSVQDILKELVGTPQHGDSGGYQYADIPPAADANWEPAPVDPEDGELCFRLDRSALDGSFTALDFTYFQTRVAVTNINQPFIIRYNQVDDGVRAYVFNSMHPEGAFIDGGDARLYFTPKETDLSPLFVLGENRIVLVQFDDSQTANYLKAVVIYEEDECLEDTVPPQVYNELDDGTLVLFSDFLEESYDCGGDSDINPVAVDNCDPNPDLETIQSVNQNVDDDGFVDGTFAVTLYFTVVDESGNEKKDTFTYTRLADMQPPQLYNVLENGTQVLLSEYLQTSYDCGEEPILNVRAVDDCDPNPLLESIITEIPNTDGSTTVTLEYTAQDESNNEDQKTFAYTTSPDTEAPTITRIFSFLFEDEIFTDTAAFDQNLPLETVDCRVSMFSEPWDQLLVTDNCDADPNVIVAIDSMITPEGDFRYNYTVTAIDAAGNTNVKTAGYIRPKQELVCPTDTLTVNLDETGVFLPDAFNLGIDDYCFLNTVTFDPAQITTPGITEIFVAASDLSGNTSSCRIPVNVEGDVEPCNLRVVGVVQTGGSCPGEAIVTVFTSGSDNELEFSIDGGPFQLSNEFSGLLPGSYTVTVREVDNPGCANEFPIEVAGIDLIPPTITLPTETNFTVAPGQCEILIDLEVAVSDNCTVDTLVYTIDGEVVNFPYFFPLGITTVSVAATDGSGNTSTGTFDVTVGTAAPTTDDFISNGDAALDGGTAEPGICHVLTPDAASSFGSVWYQNRLNLNEDFFFDFSLYFGNKEGGADGIVFVIQPVSTGEGNDGGGIGYQDITPSLAVEFDTWQNFDNTDPVDDHVGIQQNGNPDHGSADALVVPVPVANLEDAAYHQARVTWESATMTLSVSLDGELITTYTGDIITNIFNGDPAVFAGWTAATGDAFNRQLVCLQDVAFTEAIDTASVTMTNPCDTLGQTGAITLEMTGGVGPYTFAWSNGGTSETIDGLTAGTYSVTVTDQCGSLRSFTFELEEDENCPSGLIGANPASLEVKVSPNPFHSEARLAVTVPEDGRVSVEIRNMRGQVVHRVDYDTAKNRERELFIQRNELGQGVYMITVKTLNTQKTIRAVILQ